MHPAIRTAVLAAAVTGSIFGQRFAVRDTGGAVHSAAEWRGHPAVVLFFVTPECPLSNSYVPEMNRVLEEYANRGVLLYAVQPDFGRRSTLLCKTRAPIRCRGSRETETPVTAMTQWLRRERDFRDEPASIFQFPC